MHGACGRQDSQRAQLPPTLADSAASAHEASQDAATPDQAPTDPGGAPAAPRTVQAAHAGGGGSSSGGGAVEGPPSLGVHTPADELGCCDDDSVRAPFSAFQANKRGHALHATLSYFPAYLELLEVSFKQEPKHYWL